MGTLLKKVKVEFNNKKYMEKEKIPFIMLEINIQENKIPDIPAEDEEIKKTKDFLNSLSKESTKGLKHAIKKSKKELFFKPESMEKIIKNRIAKNGIYKDDNMLKIELYLKHIKQIVVTFLTYFYLMIIDYESNECLDSTYGIIEYVLFVPFCGSKWLLIYNILIVFISTIIFILDYYRNKTIEWMSSLTVDNGITFYKNILIFYTL